MGRDSNNEKSKERSDTLPISRGDGQYVRTELQNSPLRSTQRLLPNPTS